MVRVDPAHYNQAPGLRLRSPRTLGNGGGDTAVWRGDEEDCGETLGSRNLRDFLQPRYQDHCEILDNSARARPYQERKMFSSRLSGTSQMRATSA